MRWLLGIAACSLGCGQVGLDTRTDGVAPADAVPSTDAPPAILRDCGVYLRMDEADWAGGAAIDSCGGPAGIVTGGAAVVDDPTRGRVGAFPGGTACVQFADGPSNRPGMALTLSAWVFPTALDGTTPFGIISKRAAYQDRSAFTLFLWDRDTAWIDVDTEDDRFGGAQALSNDRWTQLTAVFDGSRPSAERTRLYVDGVLDTVSGDSATTITPFAVPLRIGCMPDLADPIAFVGRLDEVVAWNRALEPGEVAAWYAQTRR